MHIPTVQSLLCLSLLSLSSVSAVPLTENVQPRAATTCNANDIKTVNNSNKQPVTYCKSWLANKQSKSNVKGLTVAQVSGACKCIQASASSSSLLPLQERPPRLQKGQHFGQNTVETSFILDQSIVFNQELVLDQKLVFDQKDKYLNQAVNHIEAFHIIKSVDVKKDYRQVDECRKQQVDMDFRTSSSASIRSTSTSSHLSSSVPSTTSSTMFSADAIPMDPVTSVVANQKAPTGVSTRTSSSTQTSSSTADSKATSSPSANTKNVSSGSNVITNGMFSQGSTTGWHGARAFGTKFSVASLAGDSNYEALVKYSLAANDNASGQLYQNVTIPANSTWQLSADVYLNYPSGLPAGVACVVKYSLGSDDIILEQYGVASSSGPVLSDTASGQLSQGFTGRFMIDTYCNSASSSAASFALGFGNIRLLVSDAGSATTTAATTAAATTTSKASSTPSSTTGTNMLTNGNFGTGDYSGWALYRLGNPTFAVQGNPNAYVSVISFPAGGDSSSQAALLQQSGTAKAGKTYTASMGLLLNYPNGLPNDGSSCSLQMYFVDSNGFGVSFAQTSYKYGDAAYQSITGSGTVNNGFDGVFDILIRCYGSAQAIVAGVEDVQLFES
ncbi:unnamed protein product [Aureobasidium vineae]|uniref:Uncharacterized protein n=1 Tax=Aureobasidium vineae TaxID=2773715 RepID=A0A9N8K351_9PEZI|nr:unnamed protein product [Aureobasidium vineae]